MVLQPSGPLLAGKTALVTGGANGIGRATVQRMAAEGADVAIFDIDEPRMKEAVAEVKKAGRKGMAERVDLTRWDEVKPAVDRVLERLGRIDVLAAVAGGSGTTPTYLSRNEESGEYIYNREGLRQLWTEDITEEDWDGTIDMNLKGVFLPCKAVIPGMKERGSGSIVTFSSIGAFIGMPTSAFAYAAYAAAKAGVTGLTRHLARELAPFGIRANCVSPGGVANERLASRREIFQQALEEDLGDEAPSLRDMPAPIGRLSTTEEQANAVIFFASEMSSYVTGAILDVNGGRYMR